jgi:hypothetical protein
VIETRPSQNDLERDLARAWTYRRAHQIESALTEFLAIKSKLKLPQGELAPLSGEFATLAREHGAGVADSLASLAVALERSQGKLSEADRIAQEAQAALATLNSASAALAFERGLNAFVGGDYTRALESFIAVRSSPHAVDASLAATVNAILCLENLGLPYARLLEEVSRDIASLNGRATDHLKAIRSQLKALDLRQRLRAGRIEAIDEPGYEGQALYLAAWTAQLPFILPSQKDRAQAAADFLSAESSVYHRSYRARTIQGLLAPEDLEAPKLSEHVDRLYLWVWRWIESGDPSLLSKCLTILSKTRLMEKLDRITREDAALLENALMWLALFDVQPSDRIEEIERRLPKSGHKGFELLELERQALHVLHAARAGQTPLADDFRKRIASHPLWDHPRIGFKAIVHAAAASPASTISARLAPLFGRASASVDAALTIDLPRGLLIASRGKKTVSHAMARALFAITHEQAPSFERLAECAFGIRRYDSAIHANKISNLLSRARRQLPKRAAIQTQDGRVVASGDWTGVAFVGVDSSEINLSHFKDWVAVFGSAEGSLKNHVVARNNDAIDPLADEVSRAELEQLIDRPRSTTNRLISSWIKQGHLDKIGQGRSTRYRLSSEFRKLIVTKGVSK